MSIYRPSIFQTLSLIFSKCELLLTKSHVSITVWKPWKDHVGIIRHRIRHGVQCIENLRFDKDDLYEKHKFIKKI